MAELLDETYGAMAFVSFDNNLNTLGMQYAELQTQVQITWDIKQLIFQGELNHPIFCATFFTAQENYMVTLYTRTNSKNPSRFNIPDNVIWGKEDVGVYKIQGA